MHTLALGKVSNESKQQYIYLLFLPDVRKSPVGDIRALLNQVTPAADVRSPLSQAESENLFDDDFVDATENTPHHSQASSVQPLNISMDVDSQIESNATSQDQSQQVEGETISDESRLQRFRLKSVGKSTLIPSEKEIQCISLMFWSFVICT